MLFQKPEKGRMRVHRLTNVNRAIKHLEEACGVSRFVCVHLIRDKDVNTSCGFEQAQLTVVYDVRR